MYNSILQFIENDIKEIEKNVRSLLDGEMVKGSDSICTNLS